MKLNSIRTFLCFCLILSISTVYSQRLHLIINGGGVLSQIAKQNFGTYIEVNQKSGLNGGVGLDIGLSKKNTISLQPQLLFLQKGMWLIWKKEFIYNNIQEYNYQFNYFELPIPLKLNFNIGKFNFFILCGPSLGYGLNGMLTTNYNNKIDKIDITFNNKDRANKSNVVGPPRFDFSLISGIGLSYKINNIKLIVESRYGWGLMKIKVKSVPIYGSNDITFYNRFLLINTGVSIPISKQ